MNLFLEIGIPSIHRELKIDISKCCFFFPFWMRGSIKHTEVVHALLLAKGQPVILSGTLLIGLSQLNSISQGFPNSVKGKGRWKIMLRFFLLGGGNLTRSDFDHSNLSQG